KAGGIAVVDSPEEAHREAARILAMEIRGYPVRSVWCKTGLEIAHELYLGITLDRDRRRLALILSAAGGMEIEEVAATSPERIAKLWPDPFAGPRPFEVRELAFAALAHAPALTEARGHLASALVPLAQTLYRLAMELDAVTCEINPLALTGEDPYEAEAKRRGLTYVHLPGGSIGCIGNGAGLVMNTLDLVQQVGGRPNNFLDIGGGANAEKVRSSLAMILSDPDVRGVFINIFGGITRGDEVARGIVQARDELGIAVPLVVRMTGTNEVEGRRILAEAGIVPGTSAPEAARKIVELVGGAG